MKVPLLDLKAQYNSIRAEIEPAVREVMESQQFILGPQVKACETALAAYCGCKHAVTVSSGSDALLVSLMALDIAAGDEVITTPYTFFAGAPTPEGEKPDFESAENRQWRVTLARGKKTWVLLNHCWNPNCLVMRKAHLPGLRYAV